MLCCTLVLFFFSLPANAVTREYWIAADEVLWDYAPSYPINLMSGQEFTDEQRVFVEAFVGRKYWKAKYRKYDRNFNQLVKLEPEEEHLGILGPIIRAEVGDTIVVHFRNNASFPTSMHPHGVFYDKSSEGAPYDDGTGLNQKDDDIVQTGGEHTYVWNVPERAGPGPNDPSSIIWVYHSHVDEPGDTNAGLVGPIIITAKGMAKRNGAPLGIDREYVSLFTVLDENASTLAERNLSGYEWADPEAFEESNLMHGINGLVYGNNTGYVLSKDDRVRWYIIGMGTEVDLHTPHWHGQTLLQNGVRIDVAEILPAATKTFEMRPDNPGKWMFHCHVNDHITAGMMTTFTVGP